MQLAGQLYSCMTEAIVMVLLVIEYNSIVKLTTFYRCWAQLARLIINKCNMTYFLILHVLILSKIIILFSYHYYFLIINRANYILILRKTLFYYFFNNIIWWSYSSYYLIMCWEIYIILKKIDLDRQITSQLKFWQKIWTFFLMTSELIKINKFTVL